MYRFLLLLGSFLLISCSQNTQRKTEKIFLTPPSLPLCIQTEEGKQAFLAEHYWDNLNLKDTTCWKDREQFEITFVNYVYAVGSQEINTADRCIEAFMNKLLPYGPWVKKILQTAEFYLYDVESPIANEAMYVPFLKTALKAKVFSEEERLKYEFQLAVASKNNPGKQATDFSFVDVRGKRCSLYNKVKKLTLLCFSDPDCESCQKTTQRLKESRVINGLLNQGALELLMIYTEGDRQVWNRMRKGYPAHWTLGFDEQECIRLEGLYELRAMPTLYLLDANCRVLLKDKPLEVVEGFLVH